MVADIYSYREREQVEDGAGASGGTVHRRPGAIIPRQSESFINGWLIGFLRGGTIYVSVDSVTGRAFRSAEEERGVHMVKTRKDEGIKGLEQMSDAEEGGRK